MKDGLQQFCKPCHRESLKVTYKRNPAATLERQRNMRDAKREYVCKYLGTHPCIDCGEANIVVLDFDHLGDKTKAISVMIWSNLSLEAIKREIEKCVVRCANCHRIKTARERGQYKWQWTQPPSVTS